MRSTFGPTDSKLLCINSAQNMDDELKDNPWKIHALTRNDSPCFLDIDDLSGLREFMQDFSSKHIIPHMEQKIRILNQQVSATRKGFKNQIKNLWWRKGKEDAPETTNGPIYTFSSIESQIRVLGDYAFMLRDYELALSNYRLLFTDYKLDKAWMRYAGVQEMMGLSFFMLDQSRKEAEYCLETAFSTYLKIGSSAQRNATRCGLWWSEMLKARDQFKDAASVYVRISNEEPSLHAAVMLEQASHCYLMSNPPMLRKFGFHLVLAGVRYYLCDLRHHAIRTYRSALFVYKGNAWGYISDQVHFNIGRWYAFFGIFDVALKHMLEVLACSHQPLATQDLFLREFFSIVQNMGTIFEVDNLPLPVMNMSSLNVIYEDHRTYASSANVGESESLWLSLEEEMVPSVSTMRSNWLDAKPKSFPLKKYNDFHVSVVGEAIKVKFEIKNPLQISISVSSFSLICELSAKSEATKFEESASDVGLQDDAELREGPSCRNINNDISSLILSKLDFVLAGGETKMVELDVTPKLEGALKLVGVRWTLSGSVVGYQYFDVDTKKKHRKGKRETSHPAISNLNFIVIKGLPKLVGAIQDLPRKAYVGDLQLHMLQLRNESDYHVKNMKMKISHPRFLIPGRSEDLNKDFPSYLEKRIRPETEDVLPNVAEQSKGLLFSFPSDITIQGGTTFLWPLWLHTGISGKINLYISIYYEMESCSSDMSYRLLRMHYDLEVLPSMDVSFLITPCPLRLQEFLVRMDIINRANSECFYLQQLSCVCDQWEISLLPASVSAVPLQVVSSGQALSRFFKLKDCRRSLDHESKHGIKGSDILLGLKDSKEMLIDISRSPFNYFHQHERYHQGKSPEGGSDTVDFVLILKTQENESQLLSIHTCHCSFSSRSPISWLMDAPRMILHDFSDCFCEVSLHLTVRNCSEAAISLRIATFDTTTDMTTVPDSSGSRGGWHDVPIVDNIKGVSDVDDSRSISPFVWCASSSMQLKLDAACSAEIPLRICVFSPGTYDLSNYELHWKLEASEEGLASFMKRPSSGVERGQAFYLTVLQQPSP